MKPRTRGAASVLSAVALAASIQVPAEAATYTHVDAKHDVERFPQQVQSPRYRKADVTRLRVNHSKKAVRFTIRLRSGSLSHLRFRVVDFTVRTPGDTFTGSWTIHHGSYEYFVFDATTG